MRNLRVRGGFILLILMVYPAFASFIAHDLLYPLQSDSWTHQAFEIRAVRTEDGIDLPVGVHDAGADAPTVMVFVGNVGSRAYFSALYAPLLKGGATVIAMPYRGAEGISGPAREANFRADARAVHDALPGMLDRDPGTIHVVGYSLGTGLALDVAAERGAGKALLVAPFARLCEVMAGKSMLPACHFPWIDSWDNLDRVPQLETQVSILHGMDDTLISVSQSEKLAEALESAGILQSYKALEGMGHNDIVGAGQVQGLIQDWVLSLSPG